MAPTLAQGIVWPKSVSTLALFLAEVLVMVVCPNGIAAQGTIRLDQTLYRVREGEQFTVAVVKQGIASSSIMVALQVQTSG